MQVRPCSDVLTGYAARRACISPTEPAAVSPRFEFAFCENVKSLRILPLFGIALSLLGACSNDCDNIPFRRVSAPGGKHDAVLFERNCGATTGFSTQVSIVDPREIPSGGANIFSADSNKGIARAGAWGGPDVIVRWQSESSLLVQYPAGTRIFDHKSSHDGISVNFHREEP